MNYHYYMALNQIYLNFQDYVKRNKYFLRHFLDSELFYKSHKLVID